MFLLYPENEAFAKGEPGARPRVDAGENGCLALFLLPFVVAGVVIVVLAARELWTTALLETRGVEAAARVLSREVVQDDGASYCVTYAFSPGEAELTRRESVSEKFYGEHFEGAGLTVCYLPDDPAVSRISPISLVPALLVAVFALFWSALVGGLFFATGRALVRARRLVRAGRLVPGRVLSCASWDSEGDLWIKLRYELESPSGFTVAGDIRRRVDQLKGRPLPRPGDPISICYASDRVHAPL
ncbi:DUF3592 domain-containing protein [bacterium]|nr:DUF3592 domain-containing protein [bacterium]